MRFTLLRKTDFNRNGWPFVMTIVPLDFGEGSREGALSTLIILAVESVDKDELSS